jgi:magnesium chelatase subunit I
MVPEHLVEIVARFTRLVRDSNHVDQRSGVSARFAIAGLETVAASAVRRAAVAGETRPVARVVDLPSIVPASRGKVEFADSGSDPDDERETEVLEHLLRQATAQTFRARCAGLDLTGLQEHFTGGETVESGELVPAAALLGQLGTIPKLAELLGRLGVPEGEQSAEQAAAAVEFALEGLYLTRRLAKDTDGQRTVYGA